MRWHWISHLVCAHLATIGVTPIVKGTLIGSSAFVHKKAIAKDEPLLVTAFASQERSSGLASAFRSFSAIDQGNNWPQNCLNSCCTDQLCNIDTIQKAIEIYKAHQPVKRP